MEKYYVQDNSLEGLRGGFLGYVKAKNYGGAWKIVSEVLRLGEWKGSQGDIDLLDKEAMEGKEDWIDSHEINWIGSFNTALRKLGAN